MGLFIKILLIFYWKSKERKQKGLSSNFELSPFFIYCFSSKSSVPTRRSGILQTVPTSSV